MKLLGGKDRLEIKVDADEPGYTLRLQTASEDLLLEFKVNPRKTEYVIDLSGLSEGAYWVLLRHDQEEVRRGVFQVV